MILKQIPQDKILPLYFHSESDVIMAVLKTLCRAGIRMVEYTNRGEATLENLG